LRMSLYFTEGKCHDLLYPVFFIVLDQF